MLYGTVSTIANMRNGTVALGAVETGLITAGSVQLAQFYGMPCRSVGSTTESKKEDYQAGFERFATLLPAVLGGVDYITCAGTLDSSMLESDALLVMDDEICGAALRMRRGIEVNETTPGDGRSSARSTSRAAISPNSTPCRISARSTSCPS